MSPNDRTRFEQSIFDHGGYAANLLALEALLRDDTLELVSAHSGPEALELLLVNEFGLALFDMQMPGMDGFELAELMRGTERTRSIPIIFITAVATDDRRRFRGYEAGAVDYRWIRRSGVRQNVTSTHCIFRSQPRLGCRVFGNSSHLVSERTHLL